MTLRRSLCAAILVCSAQAALGAMPATPASVSGFPGQTTAPIQVTLTFTGANGGTGTIQDAGYNTAGKIRDEAVPSRDRRIRAAVIALRSLRARTARSQRKMAPDPGPVSAGCNVRDGHDPPKRNEERVPSRDDRIERCGWTEVS